MKYILIEDYDSFKRVESVPEDFGEVVEEFEIHGYIGKKYRVQGEEFNYQVLVVQMETLEDIDDETFEAEMETLEDIATQKL